MTDNGRRSDINDQVPGRPCAGPPYRPGEPPRHPRPAGVETELPWTYAVDFYTDGGSRPDGPLDLRPFLDILAAHWDQCHACVDRHATAVGADPVLTTHVIGVTLLAMGIGEANAVTVARGLDPEGSAVALTIRNSGLPAAVAVASRVPDDRRRDMVRYAVGKLAPLAWLSGPVSNFCPPVAGPPAESLGDQAWLSSLRDDGFL